jgi:hypothetical protein
MRETLTPHNLERHVKAAISFARDSEGGSKYLQGFTFFTRRCTLCPTQVNIEVAPTLLQPRGTFPGRKKPHVLSVKFYTDFGKCQSPDEMEWRALTTWHKRPDDKWKDLPPCARSERQNVPAEQWSRIDLTHMEPISARFERHLAIRPNLGELEGVESNGPPSYDSVGWDDASGRVSWALSERCPALMQ